MINTLIFFQTQVQLLITQKTILKRQALVGKENLLYFAGPLKESFRVEGLPR